MKKYLDQIKGTTAGVTSAVSGKATSTFAGAQDAIGDVKGRISETVAGAARSITSSVDSTYTGARDSVLDARDKVVGTVTGVVDGVANATGAALMVGIVVAPIVAPVPTLIGAVILLIIGHEFESAVERASDATTSKRERRKFERAVTLLQKHGEIPETALLESEFVRLQINTQSGVVDGTILAGQHEGQSIAELSRDEIDALEAHSPDSDTKKILTAYRGFLDARARSNHSV
ncbi:hypothetical protein [Pseudomonas baetica]|uniref:hypothetical protein n=1 Tax=Pseudomonas baetica TaxID=674054 RepID=UPI002407431C|nr:hypothetical protein [Pseudomonas baetica]MDF9778761.1 uncharacterized protein YjbJ (UPF0337 family) [Pseudomonas baetica]